MQEYVWVQSLLSAVPRPAQRPGGGDVSAQPRAADQVRTLHSALVGDAADRTLDEIATGIEQPRGVADPWRHPSAAGRHGLAAAWVCQLAFAAAPCAACADGSRGRTGAAATTTILFLP